jgi:hypothetical protein
VLLWGIQLSTPTVPLVQTTSGQRPCIPVFAHESGRDGLELLREAIALQSHTFRPPNLLISHGRTALWKPECGVTWPLVDGVCQSVVYGTYMVSAKIHSL